MLLNESIKKTTRPFLITGPCSVESEQQMHLLVADLAIQGKTNLVRGGIWKPRTRPDSFEGLGEIALPWLVDASHHNHLPCTVEVANAKHVELALKHGVDCVWIGARTTVNPFAVQEIADSLRGVSLPVMIKNPINPDVQLWIGAFERLSKVGINDLVAVHRGFSMYNHTLYRNVPNWEIAIALKQFLPEIPLICDPSHIAGKRNLLLEISQKAMDLNYNGLMIETHPFPDAALSDSAQQVTVVDLGNLLNKLILRNTQFTEEIIGEIENIRAHISKLDTQLFALFSERMKLSELIGGIKKNHAITILQEELWKKMLNERLVQGKELGLTPEFVRAVMDAIHMESITHQMSVMNNLNG